MEGETIYDQALTNVSVQFQQAEFVADRVCPTVPVDDQAGYVYVYKKSQFRVRDDAWAPGSEVKESRMEMDASKTFYCAGHALKDKVPRGKRKIPAIDRMIDTTEQLTAQVRLNKEYDLVTRLIAGMVSGNTVDLVAVKWSNDANDPIARIEGDMLTIEARTAKRPNVLVVNPAVLKAMRVNANVRGLLTGIANIENARVTAESLAALLGLDEVIIAGALYDTVMEGQTASLAWVWPSATCGAVLAYRERNPGLKKISLAYTYRWRNALEELGGPAGAAGAQYVERYYAPEIKSDWVEVFDHYDQNIVAAEAGIRYQNAV